MKKLQWFVDVNNSVAGVRRGVATALVFLFCLFQLSGCGVIDRHFSTYDGAPRIDVDDSKIKDAVPKAEPYHPYGTRDYSINGRRYHVLKSTQGYVKRGYASWYGSKFHGGPTSTQGRYNMYAMTAASPHLPIPCYVQVTNLHNNKKVIVRVDDRGPFYGNRILDLSYVAAKKLGFVEEGVAPVKVVAIDPKTWGKDPEKRTYYAHSKKGSLSESNSKSFAKNKMFLQLGAFAKLDNAKILSKKVNKFIDQPVHIEHKKDLYHVQVAVDDSTQGGKLKGFLEQNGFEHVTVNDG